MTSCFVTLWSSFSLGEELGHWGLNTNVLETNIINLSVVLGLVFTLGRNFLLSLLDARKESILRNFREADLRAKEAQEKLALAKTELELAEKLAAEIRQQGILSAELETKNKSVRIETDTARFKQTQQETIKVQRFKAISRISKQVVNSAINQVTQKLKSRLDARFQTVINNYKIHRFIEYKPPGS